MITLDKCCETAKDIVQFSTPENIKEQTFELDENYMIALTRQNAEKAHMCVYNDTRYKRPSYEVYYENTGKSLADYSLDEFEKIVGLIAISNSTRSPKESIRALSEYIYNHRGGVLEKLDNGDISLISDLVNCPILPRREDSLISKICAYLSECEFRKNNFTINDNVVRNILPYYLGYYNVDKSLWTKKGKLKNFNLLSYGELHTLMQKIQEAVTDDLTLRDIDHILWYCYKNDTVRTSIANEIALRSF